MTKFLLTLAVLLIILTTYALHHPCFPTTVTAQYDNCGGYRPGIAGWN